MARPEVHGPSWYRLDPNREKYSADSNLGLVKRVQKIDLQDNTQFLFPGKCHLLACYVQFSGLNGATVYAQIHDSSNVSLSLAMTSGLTSGLDDQVTGQVNPTSLITSPAPGNESALAMVPTLSSKITVDGSTFVWEAPMAEQGIGMPMDAGVRFAVSSLATIYLAPAIGISSPCIITLLLNTNTQC